LLYNFKPHWKRGTGGNRVGRAAFSEVNFSELQPLQIMIMLHLSKLHFGKAKMSYHFWKELFNQNPVKERLESSYGSLRKKKKCFANHTCTG